MTSASRMRGAAPVDPERPDLALPTAVARLGIVLVEPKIPPNVGAVSRICATLGCPLFLVGPVTFREDHPASRRAGLDYWPLVTKHYLPDLDALRAREPGARLHLFTTKGRRSLWDVGVRAGDLLVFGSETEGLPREIVEAHPEDTVRIPMVDGVRSLNLSSAVAVAAFEAARQVVTVGRGTPP